MKSLRMLGVIASLGSLVVLSAPAAPVGAEPGPGHDGHYDHHGGDRLERRVDRMQERLGLSDEQADEVAAIFQEAHQNGGCRQIEDKTQRRACHQEKRQVIGEEIATVLTEDQLAEFEAMREERRARWEQRRGKQQ